MLLKLFLAFTLIPVVEIYLLIKVGGRIGALNTVALVIATGFAGAYLARLQGMQSRLRVRSSLQPGIMPTSSWRYDCKRNGWVPGSCRASASMPPCTK